MAIVLQTLLPLLFLASSALALVQVSIDCGASKPYTDKNGIKWVTDESYIANGESQTIKTITSSMPEPTKTLRVFTSRKKNCYSVAFKAGSKVRLRASFYYGNYDGKSAPPSFELMVDATDALEVETTMHDEIYSEVVYVVSGDGISVCVGQNSPGQFPFVSAIQVWELDSAMYANFDPSTALVLVDRIAYGASDTIRYPDDAFDRNWDPAQISASLTVLKSDAASIDASTSDHPPGAVLKTAVTPSDPATSIVLATSLQVQDPVAVYVNFYFADTAQLGPNDKRSFTIVVDDSQYSTDPIAPVYAQAFEQTLVNFTASANTTFTLQATSDSTFPPIVNAMEVYAVTDTLSKGTDPTDAPGLTALIEQFDALNDWSGDPCLPQNYSWDWVGCSSSDSPRITALYLSGYGLSGGLPDLSSMDALQTIDLHNNSIGGAIPDFLGKMPNLKELNLADNSFSGPIPYSLSNNKNVKLVTSGNPSLCASGQSCRVISPPPNSPGTRKAHASLANKKTSKLGSVLALMSLCFAFVIVY